MKSLLFLTLFYFQVSKLSAQDNYNNIQNPNDSIRQMFLNLVLSENIKNDIFLKIYFRDSLLNETIAMIPERIMEDYFEKILKIDKDSVQFFLFKFLQENGALPLKDTLHMYDYFRVTKIDTNSLLMLHKSSLKQVMDKYFSYGGTMKKDYWKSEFLLACYLFDKCVILTSWYAGLPSISYAETNKLLGYNWTNKIH